VQTETRDEPDQTERRRTGRRSRILLAVVWTVLLGAVGLTIVDMVGQSDREVAQVRGGVAYASTTARDFGYVPDLVITANGVPLRLTIRNQGVHTHTFTIDSLGIDVVIPPGTTTVVTLHPAPGRYFFYCRFHQSLGMRGHLVVSG
jgi:plastocyanin